MAKAPPRGRDWALATVAVRGRPVGVLEIEGRCYRLRPALARVGARPIGQVAALLSRWEEMLPALDAAAARVQAEDAVNGTLLAPLLYPGKVVCAGANYYDHIAEMGVADTRKEAQRLFFFLKPPRTTIVGPGPTVRMPFDTRAFDWEIELAAVIGQPARNVPAERALEHVACWTIALDLSARDKNRAPETFYKLDWVAGKANDTCCPIGPRLLPARAIPDVSDVPLRLWVNGELKQDGSTRNMIFSVAEQIAIASRIMTLEPGDLLLTGTPAGVGAPKGTFLAVGDEITAEIPPIGRFSVIIQPEG